MKKNNLFKAVGVVILAYVLISWIVPIIYGIGGWKGDVSHQIGFVSLLSVILETFSGFGTTVLYVLLVGAFYGVLKATGAYDAVMDTLSDKSAGKEKVALVVTIVVLALVSSIAGLDLGLLVIFPLLIGYLVKIGYDKLTAVAATAGATLVGMYGATFAGTLYGANNTILGLKGKEFMWARLLLFVLGLAALLVFVLLYVKKNGLGEVKPVAKKAAKAKKAVKDAKKKVEEKVSKKVVSGIPALVIICLLLLVFILGTTNWAGIFGSNWFETAHNGWTGWTVAKFPILEKLFGGVEAFGTWFTPVRFQIYSLLLIVAMFVITLLYRTKLEESFDGFVDGMKSFVVPAILTVLACSVFVFVYYNPVITPLTNALLSMDFWIFEPGKLNVGTAGIYTILNSIFYVDYYYLAYSVLYGLTAVFTDARAYPVLSVLFVNLYSLVMFVAPTSVLLLVSLSISEVKYTEWFKFIWKLVLVLFAVSFVVFSIMVSV